MIINLPDSNAANVEQYFVGDRKRLASCTAVCFANEDRLLAASLSGLRIYLLRYDMATGQFDRLDEIETRYGDTVAIVDLMDFDGRGTVVASNLREKAASLYRLANDRLTFEQTLPINDPGRGITHGVKFVPPDNRTVCVTTHSGDCAIYFIDPATKTIGFKFSDSGWKPKDICFISRNLMFVAATNRSPKTTPHEVPAGKFSLIELDLGSRYYRVLDVIESDRCHADCCDYANGKVYITDQVNNAVRIVSVNDNKLYAVGELGGYDFPHGLDIRSDGALLAVTNYGVNTVDLRELTN